MRADRLVAILLMLQRRERVTAAQVAEELEISERTARRDLDALGLAGLPVYSVRGRGGGWALAGGGRTDLSGLNAAEVRTLFLLAGPAAGTTPELRAALRKLVRALPESFRAAAESAARSVVVDRTGWDAGAPAASPDPPWLDAVQHAVVEGRQAEVSYVARDGAASLRTVHPLGLAVKGSAWYLVAGTERGQRTFRVDRMTAVTVLDDPVLRPADFDLAQVWQTVVSDVDRRRNPANARALVDTGTLPLVRWVFGPRLRIGPAAADGRIDVELRSGSIRALAGEVAGFGAGIEVVEPPELRACLAEIAAELAATYAPARPGARAGTAPVSDQ